MPTLLLLSLLLSLPLGAAHAKPGAKKTAKTTGAAAAPAQAAWALPDPLVDEYNTAVQALRDENPALAVEIATKVSKQAPDSGPALVLLGQALVRANRPQDALVPCQRAVDLFPGQVSAHVMLAEAAFGAQQFVLAEAESAKAFAMEPANVRYATFAVQTALRLGHLDEARARLGAAKLGPADRACLEATILVEAPDLVAAKAAFARCDASADASLRSVAEGWLGAATGDSGAFHKSAAELGLTGYELAERGTALVNAGEYAEAVPALQAALVALPRDISVRINLAVALLELGRYGEAEALLAEVVASDTWVDVHASGNMSGILTKRTEERMHEAQRQAAALLVRVQALSAKTGPAGKTLADARAKHGDVIELVVAEADLREAEGRPTEAWALLRAAVARGTANPALARAVASLAVRHPEGLDSVTAVYVRTHGRTVDRLNLAFGESNGEDFAGCLADVEAVLAVDPEAPRAAQVGYACAVYADEVDRAAPLLARLGPGADRRMIHDHALALQDKGRHAESLALLALYPGSGEDEPRLRTLAVRAHLHLEQWPEAVALAQKPGLEPRFVAWVGQEVLQADRKNDAARLLGDACPKLTGADAETCREMLAHAAQ